MKQQIVYHIIWLSMYSAFVATKPAFADYSWNSINCNKFELVVEDSRNKNESEQIFLDNMYGRPSDPGCPCFGIKKKAIDELNFDNYDISASMLFVNSDHPERFGDFGLIFNFQDDRNFDYIYLT